MNMLDHSLQDLHASLLAGSISAEVLREAALERCKQAAPLNALISLTPEATPAGPSTQPLHGIPFVHKDNFLQQGTRTTCASKMLEHFVAPFDATVSARLKQAGALCIGKANMDEFAMGSSNEHSYFGAVRNPWDLTRVPGGSSGGSAALVAAGVVPFATGSDTGGSIRQPAAFCGVSGIKPSYGRVSRFGVVAYASSLDCPGVLARSAADLAYVLSLIAGPCVRDATCVQQSLRAPLLNPEIKLEGLRIGLPKPFFGAGVDPEVARAVRAALADFQAQGAQLIELDWPEAELAIPCYYVIAPAEASSNLSRYDGVRFGHRSAEARSLEALYVKSRSEGFGKEVQRRILLGTFALSSGYYDAYYLRALKVRRVLSDSMRALLTQVDVLAGPTAPTVAFKLGSKTSDPLEMYAADVNTVAVNLAGLPALSIPCGFAHGLPVGLQLIAGYLEEEKLLSVANRYQQLSDWHSQRPPVAERLQLGVPV
jgi:aspartyl-tRNA(Asn)/glutamyl-tRNA(Gln) amidotransferase subunit A